MSVGMPLAGEREKDGVKVVECSNLRRDSRSGSLVAAPRAPRCTRLSSLPLAVIGAEGSRMALVMAGQRIRVVSLDDDAASYDAGGVSGTVTAVLQLTDDEMAVMTDVDRYRMERDAGGRWSVKLPPAYPVMQFAATDEMRLSADVSGRPLSGSYTSRSVALNAADTRQLTADLLEGYAELADRATRGGVEMQPLLARYRLEGKHGETLYRSPAVLVGASSGVQCVSELQCTLEENNSRRGTLRIAADVYRLTLRRVESGGMYGDDVRRLVVETSLPVHPVDAGVNAANVISRGDNDGALLRCFLPGASVTMVSAVAHVARKLRRLAGKGDMAFHEAAVIHNPFAGDAPQEFRIEVNRGGVEGVEAEIDAVRRQLAAKVTALSPLTAACRVPNRFVATSGCVAGDNVVWGDVTVKGFAGYRVEEMTAERTAAGTACPWRCVVITTLASGERRVATSWGAERAPLTLSPLLCYPRGDAERMTVELERDGKFYRADFPLRPDEERGMSLYVDPACARIALAEAEGSFAYVSDEAVERRYQSAVVSAPLADAWEVRGSVTAGAGRVVSLMNVDRRGSAWEFGDARVYAMTTSGIYLTALSNGGSKLRCSRIDCRAMMRGDAACHTDDDRYAVVAVASGDLVGLCRGNAVTLRRNIGADVAAWDSRYKELWVTDAGGQGRVLDRLDGGWRTVAGLEVLRFRPTAAGLLIESDLGVRDTALPSPAMTEFAYRVRVNAPAARWYRQRRQWREATVEIYSADINAVMEVLSGTFPSGEVALGDAKMAVSGAVNAPLVMGLQGFCGPVVEVGVYGEMAVGSGIARLEIVSQ